MKKFEDRDFEENPPVGEVTSLIDSVRGLHTVESTKINAQSQGLGGIFSKLFEQQRLLH